MRRSRTLTWEAVLRHRTYNSSRYWFRRLILGQSQAEAQLVTWETKLWTAVRNTSAYWFHRLIVGLDADGSHAAVNGCTRVERQAMFRHARRKQYWRLKAQGLTYWEIRARIAGRPAAVVREQQMRIKRRMRARWGGDPSSMGSEAQRRKLMSDGLMRRPR